MQLILMFALQGVPAGGRARAQIYKVLKFYKVFQKSQF